MTSTLFTYRINSCLVGLKIPIKLILFSFLWSSTMLRFRTRTMVMLICPLLLTSLKFTSTQLTYCIKPQFPPFPPLFDFFLIREFPPNVQNILITASHTAGTLWQFQKKRSTTRNMKILWRHYAFNQLSPWFVLCTYTYVYVLSLFTCTDRSYYNRYLHVM